MFDPQNVESTPDQLPAYTLSQYTIQPNKFQIEGIKPLDAKPSVSRTVHRHEYQPWYGRGPFLIRQHIKLERKEVETGIENFQAIENHTLKKTLDANFEQSLQSVSLFNEDWLDEQLEGNNPFRPHGTYR